MSRGRITSLIWLLLALLLAPSPAFVAAQDHPEIAKLKGQVRLGSEDHFKDPFDKHDSFDVAARTVARFADCNVYGGAAAHLLERLPVYDEALETYQSLLFNRDDANLRYANAPLPGSGFTSRDDHALAQDQLRRLPPSLLARYRKEVDAEAARLLADGVARRDPLPLRKLVRNYRASSHGDQALAVLGDLAFERGDFDQALDCWRRIVPPASQLTRGEGNSRAGVDVPRIVAKQTLAAIFAGRPGAGRECDAYRALFPNERGTLANQTDAYHAILSHWLDLRRRSSADDDAGWPTFAGAAGRNRLVGKAPHPRLWLDGAAWRVPLPKLESKDEPIWLSVTRSLNVPRTPFHPVIADGQVVVSDGRSIYAFDLLTGKPRFTTPPPRPAQKDDAPDATFSVSTTPRRIFARLGTRAGDPRPKSLVCLDATDGTTLWSHAAEAGHYDSDPLVVGDRVYVGSVVRDDRTTRSLHCFDLAGKMQWETKLAETSEALASQLPRQSLLVATGNVIVDATSSGVVVAVDADTGRRAWAFRYPAFQAATSPRGPSSCLAADGRVYVAPADASSIFCLDAETGEPLWDRTWLKSPSDIVAPPPRVSEVADLLGVVDDRLIFTDRYHLQAVDAHTGNRVEWQQPLAGKLPSHGRGLLAGSWVFWPTADPEVSWRAVTQSHGTLRKTVEPRRAGEPGALATGGGSKAAAGVTPPPVAHAPGSPSAEPEYYEPTTLRFLPPGNIAYSQGCLVIAGPNELAVYVPAARQLPNLERDPEAKLVPAKSYRLAMAQFDAGQREQAQTTLADLDRRLVGTERDAWNQLIRERTLAAEPATIPKATKRIAEKPPLQSPKPAALATKLVAAWGPIAGAAPRIEAGHDVVVLVDRADVALLSPATGREVWRQPRRLAAVDWIGRSGDQVILAGRDGVEAFDVDHGRPTWRFDAPALTAAHWRLVDDRPSRIVARPRLECFQLVAGFLTFFEDRRRAFVLDCQSGAAVKEIWSNPNDALVGGETLRWPLEWDLVEGVPTPRPSGEAPEPIEFAEARRRLDRRDPEAPALHGEANGVVSLRDRTTTLWSYAAPFPMSLTGGAAHVLGDAAGCLALIPRNQGFELIRFERDWLRTGYRYKWALPASELRDGFDVLDAAVDDRAIYYASAGQLFARRLTDGSLLWKRELPPTPGPWKVVPFAGGLIAWPQTHSGIPALSGPVDPWLAAATLLHGRRGIGSVPILFLDASDGAVKTKLDVPHDRGPVFVNVAGTRLIVTAGGTVRAWSADRP